MTNIDFWAGPLRESETWLVFYEIDAGSVMKKGARYFHLPYVKQSVATEWDRQQHDVQVPNLNLAVVYIAEAEGTYPLDRVTITNIVRI